MLLIMIWRSSRSMLTRRFALVLSWSRVNVLHALWLRHRELKDHRKLRLPHMMIRDANNFAAGSECRPQMNHVQRRQPPVSLPGSRASNTIQLRATVLRAQSFPFTTATTPPTMTDPYIPLPFAATLASLPPAPPETGLSATIKKRQNDALPILVILDDDPTGTQTSHHINVLTVWDHSTLTAEFASTTSGFFILTNSRALHTPEARSLISEICTAVKAAAEAVGKDFEVVLRGDSTLRGHFPDECEVAESVLGKVDCWVLAPFFRQGGRVTIEDVHYVKDGDVLVPAAQTAFAKDASFGYAHSNLRKYVEEKTRGGGWGGGGGEC